MAIYSIEALLKCVARGVFWHRHSYLSDGWNWLDIAVLLSSYIALIIQLMGVTVIGFNLQALRTFRLLRVLTVLPGLQAIVRALLISMRKLIGVFAFVTFFVLIIAIFGIELFSGDLHNKCVTFYNSTTSSNTTWDQWKANETNWALDQMGEFMLCGNVTGAQRCPSGYSCQLVPSSPNPLYNWLSFDDLILSIIATVIVVTGDWWEEEFRVILSTSGPWSSLYFFVVVIFGAFYMMNLILSVVALSYMPSDGETKKENEDHIINSESNPGATMEVASNVKRVSLTYWLKFRKSLKTCVQHRYFEILITIVIVINTLAMAIVHHDMPRWLAKATDIVNEVCALIFAIEAAMKITALGRDYFKNRWNLLDFVVVIGSIFDFCSSYIFNSNTSLNATAIRLLRLLRILKLAQSWRTMRILLEIIFQTVTSLANLTLVLACVSFIFALIGMQLLSGTYTTAIFSEKLPRWNFDDLMRSLLTIFRILCRDSVDPMFQCFRANGLALCMPIFLGALIVGTFVVLNLFLALLLMAFSSEDLNSNSNDASDNSLISKWKGFLKSCRRNVNDSNPQTKTCTKAIEKYQQKMQSICENRYFEGGVLVMIVFSSISLVSAIFYFTILAHFLYINFIFTSTVPE